MMKVIIVDDEAPVLRLLKRTLESFTDVEVIGAYTDSVKGLQAILERKPGLCFLDIEMPEQSGIELAEQLINEPVSIVFVTAYEQYAIPAFRVNAVDYILKPISTQEIERVLTKLRPKLLPTKSHQAVMETVITFFGEFKVVHKDVKLEWPTEKVADLFAYFVYHANKKIEKWKLCELLWPNIEPEKAMHNLYNAMYLLKRLLDTHSIDYKISNKRGYYEFTLQQTTIDFEQMEQLLAASNEKSIQLLEQMERLYQGEFLSSKDYDWCQPIRTYYEEMYSRLVQQLLDYYVQDQSNDKAIVIGRKFLYLYPEQEQIAMLLMPLYLAKGELALQQFYKEYATHLMKEFNAPLAPTTQRFYEQLLVKLQLTP